MANDSAIRTKYYRDLLFLNTFGGGFLTESAPSNLQLFAELDKICLWKMSKIEGFCQQICTLSNTSTELCQVLDIQILAIYNLKHNFKCLNKRIIVLEELL